MLCFMIKVKLEDVIEQLELANDLNKSFLNKATGEIYVIPEEVETYAGNNEFDENDLPEWENELIPVARDIKENPENYIAFPDQFEIDEYHIMERFSLSLKDGKLRDEIYYSIKGSGAFSRFRVKIGEHGLTGEWYKYREEAIKEIAIEWCKGNNLEYI